MGNISVNRQQLVDKLKELFMMDQADLDFGIYRIMNAKHDEIEHFLNHTLLAEIRHILQREAGGSGSAGVREPEAVYSHAVPTTQKDEEDIFSQLYTFFSRYYHGGDFMSLRRYKKETYSPLPMNGEEVKLHWANADQYYIKSAENFTHYAFKLGDAKNPRSIRFELITANTEQNNNKADNTKTRRFILDESQPVALRTTAEGDELLIHFNYQADTQKKPRTQKLLNQQAVQFIRALNDNHLFVKDIPQWSDWKDALLALKPTEKDKKRTVLEKHLTDYTAKNSFDYFIHKDLGGFLRRELDFFIKNELLLLDDIVPDDVDSLQKQILSNARSLKRVIAFKVIAHKLIAFLAQLENFQKKLWLKKKFVLETHYCMTLDRIPSRFYEEIVDNTQQIQEWVDLGFIDVNTVLTSEDLQNNPYLLMDTSLFTSGFKQRLLAEIEDLDETTDGLLIHSENFQALKLLESSYSKSIDMFYIDPPYNTQGDDFIYKDNYKHSSWLSLISDRLELSKRLSSDNAIFFSSIDDNELVHLREKMNSSFGEKSLESQIIIQSNKRGQTYQSIAKTHEYMLCYTVGSRASINELPKEIATNSLSDDIGVYELWELRNRNPKFGRFNRPNLFFSVYIAPNLIDEDGYTTITLERTKENYIEVVPLNSEGKESCWRWGKDKVSEALLNKDKSILLAKKKRKGGWNIYQKSRKNTTKAKSIWNDTYFISEQGTVEIGGLGLTKFGFPKPSELIKKAIKLGTSSKSTIMDFFSGSGTTAHATINLNREDGGSRKYILVEMGSYFDNTIVPRMKKIIYKKNWKKGKPVFDKKSNTNGISHCFKTLRLESYEDVLDNLQLKRSKQQTQLLDHPKHKTLKEDYLLHYMLDVETKDSVLSPQLFINPFNANMRVTRNNEMCEQRIDLVETFNYLLGLKITTVRTLKGITEVIGSTLSNDNVLIIWRNTKKMDNNALDKWFRKQQYNTRDMEFDLIYVNGDNNLPNLRTSKENWKVQLIDEVFQQLMFDCQDV